MSNTQRLLVLLGISIVLVSGCSSKMPISSAASPTCQVIAMSQSDTAVKTARSHALSAPWSEWPTESA